MKTQFLNIQNSKIRVKESGTGQPVFFMHGNPDSADMWDGIIERLPKTGFRYIAPDIPAFGESEVAKDFDWSVANRGKYIADILDALGISEPIIIVGHDHGGIFVASFAVQYPERVKKLVMQNTLFHADYDWHIFGKFWRTPLLGEYLAFSQTLTLSLPMAIWYMKKGSPLLTNDYIAKLQKTWTLRMGWAMLALYRQTTPHLFKDWEEKFNALIPQKPMLVLWGKKDFYLPFKFAERWEKLGAKLISFPEAGHWLAIEKTEDYTKHLSEFIKE